MIIKEKFNLENSTKKEGKNDKPDVLIDMKAPEFQTRLLHVFKERVKNRTPSEVMRQFKQNRFLQPSEIDQRDFVKFDKAFYKKLDSSVSAVELSPVAPLGVNTVLAELNQNNVLSTIRNIEVMADTVTTLALECAKKRKESQSNNPIFICTSQREVRAQKFDGDSGFLSHFRGISMVSSHLFDGKEYTLSEVMSKHISFYLSGIKNLIESGEFEYKKITVSFSSIRILNILLDQANINKDDVRKITRKENPGFLYKTSFNDLPKVINFENKPNIKVLQKYKINQVYQYLARIISNIKQEIDQKNYKDIEFEINLDRVNGINYYTDLCFKISAINQAGDEYPLVDCGETDWTKKLLQRTKERCIAGGMGADFFIKNFKK